ncbi:MAG: C4-dicarboxylate transporter permease [Burkholderiales bacterium]|nr:C4-dicarboxylate transporter permease [Burkholderiales bacterium]
MPEGDRQDPQRGLRGGIERLVDVIGEWTSWISLVIVLVMATNVILRYLFSVGTVWAQELEWHLLVPLILFGMSYAMRHGEHVRVDILYAKFPERTKHIVDFISAVLCAALSVLVIWFSLHYIEQAYVIDEGSPDPGGIPHRYLIKSLIPIGFALLLLQSVASALGSLDKVRRSAG